MVQLSKSEMRDTLKAGHPPAVKAGGKRVVKKSGEDNSNVEKETKKMDKQRKFWFGSVIFSRPLPTSSRFQHLSLLLSGPLEKLSHDFPETPVSVRHSQVRPGVEKPHFHRAFLIQQPRKF